MRTEVFKGALLSALLITSLILSGGHVARAQFEVSPGDFTTYPIPPSGTNVKLAQELGIWNRDNITRFFSIYTVIPPEDTVGEGFEPIPDESWLFVIDDLIEIEENSSKSVEMWVNIPRWENLLDKRWEAWIRIERIAEPGEVISVRVDVVARLVTATELLEAQRWDALITATFPGGSDDAIFGVRHGVSSGFDSAYDIPEPPVLPEPPHVRAYFYYPEQIPDELHRSCLALDLMEWPLRIEYADSVENVTLAWSVENVPTEYNVLLYRGGDLVADMMAEENYTFEALAGSYDFRIVVGRIVPFTLELTQGWNMISFPVLPVNPSPDSIFGDYYVLYRWDAEDKRYMLHADSGSFIEPDPDVEPGVGYWAYVLENENVDLLGVPVNQLTLSLRLGWNLIGPPYGGSSIADPIDDPDNTVLNWAFTWDANQRRYVTTQLLEPGRGYWVYALGNCSLDLFG